MIQLRRNFGVGIFERIAEVFSRANVHCTIMAQCADVSGVCSLIKRGVGFGVIPIHAGYEPPAASRRHALTPASSFAALALVYPRGRRLLPAVQAAIELCRDLTR
jgi:DNA-binding transcriptional LysR family regulator